jgi:hypothetical protein
MYPLLFALLLTKLKASMADLQLQLVPTTIFMNLKTTAQNTARTVFPGITVKRCFFHYTQTIWRNTQHTGLQVTYINNEDIRQLVRRAAVLPLVPMDLIDDVWFNVLNALEDIDTPTNTTAFTDYVTTQWIDKYRTTSTQMDPYHKSHRGLAQQTDGGSLPNAPKHLHIDQHIQRHWGSK